MALNAQNVVLGRGAFTPAFQGRTCSRAAQRGASTEDEKDIAFKKQQEVLAARKSGKSLQDANKRRQEVSKYMKLPKEEQRKIMEAKDPGPIYEEEPKSRLGNIIIPVAPFGMPKYDNGGRFDLKAKYTDEGYEDEDADVMGKLFGGLFGKKSKGDEGSKGSKKPGRK